MYFCRQNDESCFSGVLQPRRFPLRCLRFCFKGKLFKFYIFSCSWGHGWKSEPLPKGLAAPNPPFTPAFLLYVLLLRSLTHFRVFCFKCCLLAARVQPNPDVVPPVQIVARALTLDSDVFLVLGR
jgi:hypothetical protein